MSAYPDDVERGRCPPVDELVAFGVGRLPDDVLETIAEHIERCAGCRALLGDLDGRSDALLEELRRPIPSGLFSWSGTTPAPGEAGTDAGGSGHTGAADTHDALATLAVAGLPAVPGYEVLEELAHGGMGAVYRVFDPDLHRSLAVKVLQQKYRDESDLDQRFREEAQLTGQLQHPGIPPVHDVGRLADGRPFFAMKLVRGRTLAELLAERPRGANATPLAEGLSRWLAVFAQVCQAVAYAHSRGVIHRDLKPANVMVGAFGEIQVLDWGLAKVLWKDEGGRMRDEQDQSAGSDSSFILHPSAFYKSQAGAVLGTAAYMAPEQARGEVGGLDERCDVFGLGGILCVILTGQPPYRGPSAQEQYSQAGMAELADAYARLESSGADAELVRLARMCLAGEREARLRDAGAVAAAVTAYQAGVAERLRRAELERAAAEARAKEERKRRRLAVALAAAVLGLVLVGGAGGWWFALERAQTRQGVEALVGQARELQQRFHWAEARAVLTQAARRLGTGGLSELGDQVRQAQTDLEWAARLDEIGLKRATSIDGMFDNAGAEAGYAQVFQEAGFQVAKEPSVVAARVKASGIREAWVAALDDWAIVTRGTALQEPLLRVAREADPDEWRDRLRAPEVWRVRAKLERLAEEARVAEVSPQLLHVLADRLDVLGGDAVPLLRAAQQRYPTDFWLNFLLGTYLRRQVTKGVEEEVGAEEAVGFLRAALVVRPESFAVHINLGIALKAKGRVNDAIAHYERALQINPNAAQAHNNFGAALNAKGRVDDAIARYERALQIDPNYALAHTNLGAALYHTGRVDDAIAHFERALQIDPNAALAHYNLGIALQRGHQLGMKTPGWEHPSGLWVQQVEQLIALDPKVPAILRGEQQPADTAEQLALAYLCQLPFKRQYAAAVRFYAEAFAADPKLVDVDQSAYYAACAAALAAAGKDQDAVMPDEQQQSRLRQQALDWLRAGLAAWQKRRQSQPQAQSETRRELERWRRNTDLAGVRDPEALGKLPEAERQAWQKLWAEVDQLLQPTGEAK